MSGITILYGSETGNAQDYAEFLYKRLKYYQLSPTVAALDDYPLKNLVTETKILIIVCSTGGQGELPRNAKSFMKFLLKRKLPNDLLNHISLTSFGVGDSSYPHFNYAIKKIHTRLLQLGCKEFCDRCEADEQSPEGVDGFYTEWESKLIEGLHKSFPNVSTTWSDEEVLEPECVVHIDASADDVKVPESVEFEDRDSSLFRGVVQKNERVTAEDHFQDVRHIVISTDSLTASEQQRALSYRSGDTLVLYPVNDDNSVELFIQSQPHWVPLADKPLTINGSHIETVEGGLIKTLTLRSLIKYHIDIMSIPRRSFFMTLWHFCDGSTEMGEREQEKLKEFGSFEEPEELYNYANRPRRSILETMLEFQNNLKVPIEHIFELFPKIKPRQFSIASKPSPTEIEVIVAVVEYKTMIRRVRRGLCTKWLKSKEVGSDILFSIHKSNLQFTGLSATTEPPIIMIAPGTGVAPMKSLIEEKVLTNEQSLYLFYGCRYKEKDCLFEPEWTRFEEKGLLNYFPVFSRGDPDSKCKYVQHKLIQHAKLVGDLILNQDAIVFVCGSSGSMPREVRVTLVEILKKIGNKTQEESESYLLAMENTKRYIQETW